MQYLASFKDYLKHERRYSIHTVTAYVEDVVQFFSFIQDVYETELEADVSPQMVKSWMFELQNNNITNRSLNRKLASLRAFYKFLLRSEFVQADPLAAISGLKTEKKLPEWIQEKEILGILENVYWPDDFAGCRDKLMLELLYGTGIRLAELISLKEDNVYLSQGVIKVTGKRNKERIIPVNNALSQCIIKYMEEKKAAGIENKLLCVTDRGAALYPMYVYRKVKELLSQLSQQKNISPHVLRHTFATHILNKGADINAIKELLGHTSLAATQVYTHNSIERLKNIYKQSHPKS